MLDRLYESWRARRVLIIGGTDQQTAFVQALLDTLGAKAARIPPCMQAETLCRALSAGRISAVIVPQAHTLSVGKDAVEHLRALDVLLTEVREAGVPLLILGSDVSVYRAQSRPWYAREEDLTGGQTRDGLIQSILQLYADGASRALLGDAISTLIVRYMPSLGGQSPSVVQYTRWCHALMHRELITVEHPSMQGIFLHPLEAACGMLTLGARFFAGEEPRSGTFNLGAGPQNLCANRSAALRFISRHGGTRPITECEPPLTFMPPLLDGSRARLLSGVRCLLTGDEALSMLFELEQAKAQGEENLQSVMNSQVQTYLERLS